VQKSKTEKLKAELAELKVGKVETGGQHHHHHCHEESKAKKRKHPIHVKSNNEKAEEEEKEPMPEMEIALTPQATKLPAKKIKVEEPAVVCLIHQL
jgi:hypothetical protein